MYCVSTEACLKHYYIKFSQINTAHKFHFIHESHKSLNHEYLTQNLSVVDASDTRREIRRSIDKNYYLMVECRLYMF